MATLSDDLATLSPTTLERIRSRGGRRYVADISKMVPVATAVVGMLAFLLLTGLWLDVTRPL